MLMKSRTQSIYGYVSKTSDNEFSLDWETKGPAILGMLGGLENYVAARLLKEDKLD